MFTAGNVALGNVTRENLLAHVKRKEASSFCSFVTIAKLITLYGLLHTANLFFFSFGSGFLSGILTAIFDFGPRQTSQRRKLITENFERRARETVAANV